MAEVESAEEFSKLVAAPVSMIERRDTAIREAAKLEGKREVLAEIRQAVRVSKWINLVGSKEAAWGRAHAEVMAKLEAKYQSADSQPAQDGERR